MNDNLLGRLTALALILGAAYGVHAIARGGLGCPLSRASCCMTAPQDAFPSAEKAAPSKAGAVETEEDVKLQKKAPVVPPADDDHDGD